MACCQAKIVVENPISGTLKSEKTPVTSVGLARENRERLLVGFDVIRLVRCHW